MTAKASYALGLVVCVVAAFAVTGCEKKPDESAAEAPPAAVAPMGYARAEGVAQVMLTLPDAIKTQPELHTRLYNEGKTDLDDFMSAGQTEVAEAASNGYEIMGYTRSIDWKIAGESPRLLSLYSEESEYTGGAHPNGQFQSLIWDKTTKSDVATAALFADRAEIRDVDTFLCRQIETERSKRVGEPITLAASGYSCPHITESKITLIPAVSGNGFAAIEVLFAPYEVGPYAEGPYQIRIPYSVFRNVIAPAYADQFVAGEAVAQSSDDGSSAQ